MLVVILSILSLIILFFSVVMIRTALFKPEEIIHTQNEEIAFDNSKATENLRELIKCKTVSRPNHEGEDDEEFAKLKELLPELYPNVYSICTLTEFDDHALLYKWEGKNHDAPSVFMAHYDVVAADELGWEKPPFAGILENGVLWGRGSLDTKVTFNGAMFAADHLIAEGFIPDNDIYLAFSGCEEVNGPGALHIVNYFEENGITPGIVLDEGGAVMTGAFPGVRQACAYIGVAEKGMLNVEYRVKSNGGHASAPKPHTPLGILSKACCKVESRPFPARISEPVKNMFNTLGAHSSFLYRMIFANRWCLGWIIDILGKRQGGDINALLRTTVAFTQASGSSASNVIPPQASMVSNLRLIPGDTMESALEYLKNTVNDPEVEIRALKGFNPSRISDTDCDAYRRVVSAITSTWVGCIPTPYLMMQCSDSRHWGEISDKVYRFSAMDLTKEELSSIHGNNEKIRTDCIARACEFFIRMMRSS